MYTNLLDIIITPLPPIDELWRELNLYRTKGYNQQILNGICLPPQELKDRQNIISFSIIQAEEFFKSTKGSTIVTRPLLNYYGMLALARCIISLKQPGDVEVKSLLKIHGAGFEWKGDLGNSIVTLKKSGVIPSLLKSVGDPLIKQIALKDLFALLPTLKYEYFGVYQEHSRLMYSVPQYSFMNPCFSASEEYLSANDIFVADMERTRQSPEAKSNLPMCYIRDDCIHVDKDSIYELHNSGILVHDHKQAYLSLGYVLDKERFWFKQSSILMVIFYALGMLARYHPIEWAGIVGNIDNNERLLVETLNNTAMHEFIWDVVRALNAKPI